MSRKSTTRKDLPTTTETIATRTGQREMFRFGHPIMLFGNDVFHFKGEQEDDLPIVAVFRRNDRVFG
jgi:hypothetical protein